MEGGGAGHEARHRLRRQRAELHRPRFHGKAYTSVVVEGLYGGRAVVSYLDLVGMALGFGVVGACRIVCRKNPDTAGEPLLEAERRTKRAAGAAFDRLAARSARRRRPPPAGRPPGPDPGPTASPPP